VVLSQAESLAAAESGESVSVQQSGITVANLSPSLISGSAHPARPGDFTTNFTLTIDVGCGR
jgi:antitoxin (DNA-binding transcriptional repressor) of toxin-antitoxin stability system